jgi:hypothetical protein
MSNKRAVARELKLRKKKQQQITWIGIAAGVLVICAIFAFFYIRQDGLTYAMTYEGERVPMADFQFGMLANSVTGSDMATVKTETQNLLLETLTLEHHAKQAGIVLTEEENANMLSFAAQLRSQYATLGYDFSFISDQRIAEIMYSDTYYAKLMEANTTDYVVDEADFAVSLADFKENQKAAYYDIGLKYIAFDTKVEADTALGTLTADNFDETAETYMKEPAAEGETPAEGEAPAEGETPVEETEFTVPTTTLSALNNSNGTFSAELVQQILGFEVGGRTDIITVTDETTSGTGVGAYYIFEVTHYNIPADEEVETNYREDYTNVKKNEIFRGILDKWKEEANYTINQRAIDKAFPA